MITKEQRIRLYVFSAVALGNLEYEDGHDETAIGLYRQVLDQREPGSGSKTAEGESAMDRHRKTCWVCALLGRSAESDDAEAFLMHGRVFYELVNYDQALHWFDRTVKEYPQWNWKVRSMNSSSTSSIQANIIVSPHFAQGGCLCRAAGQYRGMLGVGHGSGLALTCTSMASINLEPVNPTGPT